MAELVRCLEGGSSDAVDDAEGEIADEDER
jgi:hypothetical protein